MYTIIKALSAPFLLLLSVHTSSAQQGDTTSRYIKVPAGYLMVLRQGDDVFAHLQQLAEKEQIPSASFTGMGFVNAKFGFFNQQTRQYEPREFNDVELASMTGSIAWKQQQPSLHIHGVVSGRDFAAHGGHMLSATVGTGSLEIMIVVHDKRLERVVVQPLGANVLSLE